MSQIQVSSVPGGFTASTCTIWKLVPVRYTVKSMLLCCLIRQSHIRQQLPCLKSFAWRSTSHWNGLLHCFNALHTIYCMFMLRTFPSALKHATLSSYEACVALFGSIRVGNFTVNSKLDYNSSSLSVRCVFQRDRSVFKRTFFENILNC